VGCIAFLQKCCHKWWPKIFLCLHVVNLIIFISKTVKFSFKITRGPIFWNFLSNFQISTPNQNNNNNNNNKFKHSNLWLIINDPLMKIVFLLKKFVCNKLIHYNKPCAKDEKHLEWRVLSTRYAYRLPKWEHLCKNPFLLSFFFENSWNCSCVHLCVCVQRLFWTHTLTFSIHHYLS
jgi:hypothetical protein